MKINLIFFSVVLLFHFDATGAIQEAKSWDEFDAIMKKGGSFCLFLCDNAAKQYDIDFMKVSCNSFPKVKCYYGMADLTAKPTSFNDHFHNVGTPAVYYFKDGKLIKTIDHPSDVDTTKDEVDAGFELLK